MVSCLEYAKTVQILLIIKEIHSELIKYFVLSICIHSFYFS